jgi:hypothetical protein
LPLEEIVPIALDAPAAPFTAQVTPVLELPETVAVNWNDSPARMFALVGLTVTEVEVGVEGADGADGVVGVLLELVVALQPPSNPAARTPATTSRSPFVVRRMA